MWQAWTVKVERVDSASQRATKMPSNETLFEQLMCTAALRIRERRTKTHRLVAFMSGTQQTSIGDPLTGNF